MKLNQHSMIHKLAQTLSSLSIFQWIALLLLMGLILQIPLIFNPGYFSHDELQWAVRAEVDSFEELSWFPWRGILYYQYRPITFNLWLSLSYLLFQSPYWFHALLVFWGSFNAALLFLIVKHFRFSNAQALCCSVIFILCPYAVYVHGWVGTIADLLVMSFLLALVLGILKFQNSVLIFLLTLDCTLAGLMSKESAIVYPAVLGIAWLFDGLKKRWLISGIAASGVVLTYLYLRLPVLLQQPETTHYTISAWEAPQRWIEYYLYWVMPNTKEPGAVFSSDFHTTPIVAAVLLLGMIAVFWRSHKKLTLAFVAGGLACLLPVLPISASYPQYGYIFSVWSIALAVAIYKHSKPWGQRYLLLLGFLSVYHGVNTMKMMNRVGNIQSVFIPQLTHNIQQYEPSVPLKLKVMKESDLLIYKRLSFAVPSYLGQTIEDRFEFVNNKNRADFLILNNGEILANDS